MTDSEFWMAWLIPHSRLHVLHDGRHFSQSSLDQTSAAILDFIGRNFAWQDSGRWQWSGRRSGRRSDRYGGDH